MNCIKIHISFTIKKRKPAFSLSVFGVLFPKRQNQQNHQKNAGALHYYHIIKRVCGFYRKKILWGWVFFLLPFLKYKETEYHISI